MATLVRAAVLAAAGSLFGLGANALRRDGVALTSVVAPDAAAELSTCVAPGELQRVSLEEAQRLYGLPDVRFADVRDERTYAEGHIAGALHLPCRASAPAYLHHLGAARTVILYGAAAADDAVWVADALRKTGFADVRIMEGRFDDWRSAGGPGEAGSCEACDDGG